VDPLGLEEANASAAANGPSTSNPDSMLDPDANKSYVPPNGCWGHTCPVSGGPRTGTPGPPAAAPGRPAPSAAPSGSGPISEQEKARLNKELDDLLAKLNGGGTGSMTGPGVGDVSEGGGEGSTGNPPTIDDCGGGGNMCIRGSGMGARPTQAGGASGGGKSPGVDIVSGAGAGGSPPRFTVRRFMSRAELKQLHKQGVKFDPERGNGIPTTHRNFNPRNQDVARRRTGAPNAEYQVDLDVTGVPRGPTKTTKSGLPEYPIRGDLGPNMVIKVKKLPK
jgi:hypothetical protein